MGWDESDIPSQRERIAIVTGANSGIGFHTALSLAKKDAHVVLACRNKQKAEQAMADICKEHPSAQCTYMELDLAHLSSVRTFAKHALETLPKIDLLINNAGVMIPPHTITNEGFELQFVTNHLGHFALTGLLLERILDTENSRVVTVSSRAHNFGFINFKDLHRERFYFAWEAYGQSKLANLLFAFELDRKLRSAGHTTKSIAAHPGYTTSQITQHSPLIQIATDHIAQDTHMGALTTLRAATDPAAEGGSFWGPSKLFEMAGPPVQVTSNRRSRNLDDAAKLWTISEELSGVRYLSDESDSS